MLSSTEACIYQRHALCRKPPGTETPVNSGNKKMMKSDLMSRRHQAKTHICHSETDVTAPPSHFALLITLSLHTAAHTRFPLLQHKRILMFAMISTWYGCMFTLNTSVLLILHVQLQLASSAPILPPSGWWCLLQRWKPLTFVLNRRFMMQTQCRGRIPTSGPRGPLSCRV